MTPATLALSRSKAQRMDALSNANAIRSGRARLKKDIKAGRVSTRTLLFEPPPLLLTMKVADLLIATPRFGRVKVDRVLSRCRVSPSKTVGGLSERQRNELIRLLTR